MDVVERLWSGLVIEPMNEAAVADLLSLREKSLFDVPPGLPMADRRVAEGPDAAALELLAERGTVNASVLFKTLGGNKGRYWHFRALLQKYYWATDWPDGPKRVQPMRIEGKVGEFNRSSRQRHGSGRVRLTSRGCGGGWC